MSQLSDTRFFPWKFDLQGLQLGAQRLDLGVTALTLFRGIAVLNPELQCPFDPALVAASFKGIDLENQRRPLAQPAKELNRLGKSLAEQPALGR